MFVSLNNNGYLPPGWHAYDLTKLQEDFVEQFNESTTRNTIFFGFTECIKLLKSKGLQRFEVWIDGSFTTNKIDPSDIDFCVYLKLSDLNALSPEHQQQLNLLSTPNGINMIKETFKCHMFFVINAEDIADPSKRTAYLNNKKYWVNWFTHDRLGVEKGIVRMTFGGENND